MNHVTITGRLTRKPQLKHIGAERAVCEMRVAVDNGRHPTTYVDAIAFDGQAYTCAEYLAKGRKVGVEGRLALRELHEASGRLRQRYSVIGRVEFLDPPPAKEVGVEADVLGGDPEPDRDLALAA